MPTRAMTPKPWYGSTAFVALAAFAPVLAAGILHLSDYVRGAAPGPRDLPPPPPSPEEIARNWPRFLGPSGQGVAVHQNAPLSWNGETGEGVVWKAKVPLKGASSPVVWGNRVFLTGADENVREVYCFDADSGDLAWKRRVTGIQRANSGTLDVWDDKSYAASTPATDGRRVYAVFANGDLVSLDLEGREVWKKSLTPLENTYGHASSLAMHGDLLLVLLDQSEADDGTRRSKIAALDAATGEVVWETPRPARDSWTTPIVISAAGREQIVTSSAPWVIAYDPETGAEIWRAQCLDGDVVPSPVYANDLVFAVVEGAQLAAIRPDGKGEVTKTHVAWTAEGELPSICSPVSDGKLLFLVTSGGIMTCWNAGSGEMIWEEDIEISVVSSPTLVGNRIYVIGDDGAGIVVRASAEYEEMARPELGEYCQASPAILDGRVYVRGEEHLFCIGKERPRPGPP